MKWCNQYSVWCSDLKEIIEEPDCDTECTACEECVVILPGGSSRPVREGE